MFVGPTASLALSGRAGLTLVRGMLQIAGKAINDPNSLDLTNFERHQVRLRFALSF